MYEEYAHLYIKYHFEILGLFLLLVAGGLLARSWLNAGARRCLSRWAAAVAITCVPLGVVILAFLLIDWILSHWTLS